jgi:murein DD-endopeptidase MepM/ murein hydrolase activator NlpD
LKIKKTLYNWLTNRFLLIIRNEENFAEKRTISFNYAKLIVFGFTFFVLIFLFCLYLLYSPLFQFLNPEYQEKEKDRKILMLESKVDSLQRIKRQIDLRNMALDKILRGETLGPDTQRTKNTGTNNIRQEINLDRLSPVDIKLRREIEEEKALNVAVNTDMLSNSKNYYYLKPVEGIIDQKYSPKRGILGVNIITKPRETVKSIAEGTVVLSDYGPDGYTIALQHKNGIMSVYRHNSAVLKQIGEYVQPGDPIAISGAGGSAEQKYKLEFQIWQDGNSLNPENFISF